MVVSSDLKVSKPKHPLCNNLYLKERHCLSVVYHPLVCFTFQKHPIKYYHLINQCESEKGDQGCPVSHTSHQPGCCLAGSHLFLLPAEIAVLTLPPNYVPPPSNDRILTKR